MSNKIAGAQPVWGQTQFGAGMPQYQQQTYGYTPDQVAGGQVAGQYNWNPYRQAGGAADAVNQMNQQLGIKGPTDYRQSAYAGLNEQLSNALTAVGATGARGGVSQSMKMNPVSQFAQAGAQLEGNFANMQQAYDMARQQQAMGLLGQGQQSAQYGAGLNMQGQLANQQTGLQAQLANQQANLQNAQFGAGFNANQALQAYQMNRLAPWEFDAMVRLNASKDQAQRLAAGQLQNAGGGQWNPFGGF